MMSRSARRPGSLYALALAIDAAAMLDPYPRLAQVMQRLAIQQAEWERQDLYPWRGPSARPELTHH